MLPVVWEIVPPVIRLSEVNGVPLIDSAMLIFPVIVLTPTFNKGVVILASSAADSLR